MARRICASLYYRLDILCRPVGQPHDREHGVHAGCCRKEAAIADEETLDAMNFRVLTGYRGFGIGSHAAGSHLVGCEHHEAVYPHAMPLQLAIKLTELLLVYRSTDLPLQAGTSVMQRVDRRGARGEVDARGLAQAMQKVFSVINRDHVIDHRLTIAVQSDGALTFVAGEYNNRSKVRRLGHLFPVRTRRVPRRCQRYQAGMGGWNLQLVAIVS